MKAKHFSVLTWLFGIGHWEELKEVQARAWCLPWGWSTGSSTVLGKMPLCVKAWKPSLPQPSSPSSKVYRLQGKSGNLAVKPPSSVKLTFDDLSFSTSSGKRLQSYFIYCLDVKKKKNSTSASHHSPPSKTRKCRTLSVNINTGKWLFPPENNASGDCFSIGKMAVEGRNRGPPSQMACHQPRLAPLTFI